MAVATMQREAPTVPQTGPDARLMIRRGDYIGPTAGFAPGYVQGNLAILPEALADDLDIRTDLPRYRVWRDGQVIDEPADVRRWWRDDLVSFVLGCSFSFE